MINVYIQCGISSRIIEIGVDIYQNIKNIKEILRDDHGFRYDLLTLKLNGRLLQDCYKICEVLFETNVLLHLELIPPYLLNESERNYESLYRSITFLDSGGSECSSRQVNPNCRIVLKFDPKADVSCLIQPKVSQDATAAMSMSDVFGKRHAKERGFIQWTNHQVGERVLLVEISDLDLEQHIDHVRYKWDGVNDYYYGGDPHSWQRYTKKIPIPVTIISDGSSVVVSPRRPLQRDILYAIVLRHGIPATDSIGIVDTRPSLDRIAEDKLFFFKTLGEGIVEIAGKNRDKKQRHNSVDTITTSDLRSVEFQIQPYYREQRYSTTLDVTPTTTMLDLKLLIGSLSGFNCKDIELAVNGIISCADADRILAFNLKPRNLVHMLPAFCDAPSPFKADYSHLSSAVVSSYTPYVRSTFPMNGKLDVPVSVVVSVEFQSVMHVSRVGGQYLSLLNSPRATQRFDHGANDGSGSTPCLYHRRLVLDCFKDARAMSAQGPNHPTRCQEMCEVMNVSHATKRGYVGWHSSSSYHQRNFKSHTSSPNKSPPGWANHRILLLEVHDNLAARWRAMAYHFDLGESPGGSYRGGDVDSWQRYTFKPPVRGVIYVDNTANTVTFKPSQLLKSGTTYGVLLANGVPSVPERGEYGGSDLANDDWYCIHQDFMFFFTTAGPTTESTNSEGDWIDWVARHPVLDVENSGQKTRVSSMAEGNLSAQEEDSKAGEACLIS